MEGLVRVHWGGLRLLGSAVLKGGRHQSAVLKGNVVIMMKDRRARDDENNRGAK